jgi:hypothetical protein
MIRPDAIESVARDCGVVILKDFRRLLLDQEQVRDRVQQSPPPFGRRISGQLGKLIEHPRSHEQGNNQTLAEPSFDAVTELARFLRICPRADFPYRSERTITPRAGEAELFQSNDFFFSRLACSALRRTLPTSRKVGEPRGIEDERNKCGADCRPYHAAAGH